MQADRTLTLQAALDCLRKINPRIRVLLTVSPVPLTATNSGDHVLVATSYSKSVFFASPGAGMEVLVAQDGQLVAKKNLVRENLKFTSGGAESIAPSDFDVFFLFGLRLRLPRVAPGLSTGLRDALMEDVFEHSICKHVLRNLRKVSAGPVFVMPDPLLRADPLEGDVLAPCTSFETALDAALRRHQAVFVPQPRSSLASDGCHTAEHFSTGSAQLVTARRQNSVSHETNDRRHMNAKFGALVWNEFAGLFAAGA